MKQHEAYLLTGEANIRYLTGFYTTARRPKQIGRTAVVRRDKELRFLVPEKWRGQVLEQVPELESALETYDNSFPHYLRRLGELLESDELQTLRVEYGQLDLETYLFLKECFPAVEIKDATRRMEAARLVKAPAEIQCLRRAASVAVAAMEAARELLRPGIRERELAAELEYHMRMAGSDGVPFTIKALSGPNTETVTRVPGERALQRGDLVLLDFGAVWKGYSSDWTRTFAVGEATREQRELYELVWRIERSCIGMIRPGLALAALVERAQAIAGGHRFGSRYNPHLGHSVGITSHEWPTIEPGVTGELRENMVITIEPGIYVPGIGGVRIEDEVLVTADGCELLTGLAAEEFVV